MLNPVTGGSLASVLAAPAPRRDISQNSTFEQQLVDSLTEALGKLGVSRDQIQVNSSPAGGQTVAVSQGNRQILVTVAPPAAAPPAPAASPAQLTAEPAAALPATPIEVLSQSLAAAGISAEGLNLTESTDVVTYPGGSYTNHSITAHFGNGLQERYSVDLMLRNPSVTVTEIRRLMSQRA